MTIGKIENLPGGVHERIKDAVSGSFKAPSSKMTSEIIEDVVTSSIQTSVPSAAANDAHWNKGECSACGYDHKDEQGNVKAPNELQLAQRAAAAAQQLLGGAVLHAPAQSKGGFGIG